VEQVDEGPAQILGIGFQRGTSDKGEEIGP
jgi:hypothetical protein